MQAKEIFLQALDIEDGSQRSAFVDEKCQNDAALKRKVEALLAANDAPVSYLEQPAARFDITATAFGKSSGGVSDSSHHGRFLPGTKLAERYRIVSMLGRGGMGEVYRADDLRLGQTVALKFLPKELASDSKRLEYFHQEVKLARQISHPNICRVYDIGEVNGQHFLSMEYIDGEDLKTLLHRIGRLPKDKGVQIARQLCSGLSAAHAKGVVHRDLKPANVMIDGQGQVRITDFGLATVSADGENVIGMSGTPAYMAPEQLLRGQSSVRSDIYSLGLILFEVFTGKPVHNAGSLAELQRLHQDSSSPRSPSDIVDDMDPIVERAISRCIAPDTALRPRTVNELSAALPGGDPLAAALAAGETPDPAIVAASGDSQVLSLKTAITLLTAILVGLAVIVFVHQFTDRPPRLSPQVLMYRSQKVLEHLGYKSLAATGDFAFCYDEVYTRQQNIEISKREGYAQWPFWGFWYRESPSEFQSDTAGEVIGRRGTAAVDLWYPTWKPGMQGVRLDDSGRLRWLQVIPENGERPSSTTEPSPWSAWFSEETIGFKLEDLQTTSSEIVPPVVFDEMQAWVGTMPGTSQPLNIVAASFKGRPVYFEILQSTKQRAMEPGMQANEEIGFVVFVAIRWVFALLAVGLVIRNLVLRRWDRRGAWRLAVFFFMISFTVRLSEAHHSGGLWEIAVLNTCAGIALVSTGWMWIMYVALEPTVRRYWPGLLVSWARLLSGSLTDSKIGSDILVGTLFGVAVNLLWFPLFNEDIVDGNPAFFLGLWSVVGDKLLVVNVSMFMILFATFLLTILRGLVRYDWIAIAIAVLFFGLTNALINNLPMTQWPQVMLQCILIIVALTRFGILVAIIGLSVHWMLVGPISMNPNAFYFSNGFVSVGSILALVGFGLFTSLGGGQKTFKHRQLVWQ